MFPVASDCLACGTDYLFYASPGQEANPARYAATLPQAGDFYQANGLAQPMLQQIAQSAVKEVSRGTQISPDMDPDKGFKISPLVYASVSPGRTRPAAGQNHHPQCLDSR